MNAMEQNENSFNPKEWDDKQDRSLQNKQSLINVLVVEDDKDTASFITKGLTECGHNVDYAEDGREGLLMADSNEYHVIIVDRMLPKVDGVTLTRTLRGNSDRSPILMLSALGEVDDRVTGLKAGADDYLTKPFAFSELQARLEALVRRAEPDSPDTILSVGDLVMDLLKREVRRSETKIDLQPREFRLLEYLMRHSGQVVTRTMLLEKVWDYHFDPQTNVIDVHISRLRGKIDKEFEFPLLHTVRGAGYMLSDAG